MGKSLWVSFFRVWFGLLFVFLICGTAVTQDSQESNQEEDTQVNAQEETNEQRGGAGPVSQDPVYLATSHINQASISSVLNGIQNLDPESPLGETVNLELGSLSFSHTDVDIPGNSSLPVSFGRSYSVEGNSIAYNVYGGWNPHLPYMTALVRVSDSYGDATRTGWTGGRCMVPPNNLSGLAVGSNDALRTANAFWEGVSVNIPGEGSKLLLRHNPTPAGFDGKTFDVGTDQDTLTIFSNSPGDEGLRTSDHWTFSCLEGDGIGAVAHAPNGWKYYFDHVHETRAGDRATLRRWNGIDERPVGGGTEPDCYYTGPRSDCIVSRPTNFDNFNVWATRIEDQNGNWVEYDYEDERIQSITSNDGRRIDFTYKSISIEPYFVLDTVRANGRIWTYDITPEVGVYYRLSKLTLPDERTWEFDLPSMHVKAESYDCYAIDFGGVRPESYTVKGPTGLVGTYETELRYYGKSEVQSRELDVKDTSSHAARASTCDDYDIPSYSVSRSLISKTYSLNESEQHVWQYEYQNDKGSRENEGPAGADYNLKTTEVIDPEGDRMIAYYNREYQSAEEGLVVRIENYDGQTGGLLQTKRYEYGKGPNMGTSTVSFTFSPPRTHLRPLTHTSIERDGDTYTTEYEYDFTTTSSQYSYGNPVKTSVSTDVGFYAEPRETVTTYEHNTAKWVLGLPKTVRQNNLLLATNSYDSLGRLTSSNRFGETTSYTYHTNANYRGRPFKVTDNLGRKTELRNWKRGTPQNIIRPDGTLIRQFVDDNGWLERTIDAKNYTTLYSRDNMGRLTLTNPHGAWTNTSISYDFPSTGGAVQTITKGQAKTTITYDGMFRPILEQSQALDTGWESYTNTAYDGLGRVTFKSQPSDDDDESKGTTFTYDGLGRLYDETETVAPYAKTRHRYGCLLYTSPSPRDATLSRMPSSA